MAREIPMTGNKYVKGLDKSLKKMLEIALEKLSPKNYLIVATLIHTGARVGEVIRLKVKDFDFESKTIRIKTEKRKGDVYRIIPIPDDNKYGKIYWKILEKFIFIEGLMENEYVFFKRGDRSKHVSRVWVYYLFNFLSGRRKDLRIYTSKGVGKDLVFRTAEGKAVHPHAIRHTVATALSQKAKNIMELRSIQNMLGHSKIDMTIYYVGVSEKVKSKLISSLFKEEEKEHQETKEEGS